MKLFFLQTTHDYLILAFEIEEMYEGKPKKQKVRSKIETKKRRNKHLVQKLPTLDVNILENNLLNCGQLNKIFNFEDNVFGVVAVNASIDLIDDDFVSNTSNKFDRSSDSMSIKFLDICNPQILNQNSNLLSPTKLSWYNFENMDNSFLDSWMVEPKEYFVNDICVGSLNREKCDESYITSLPA